jgi:hypothetical protein
MRLSLNDKLSIVTEMRDRQRGHLICNRSEPIVGTETLRAENGAREAGFGHE